MSREHSLYLQRMKKEKILVGFVQIFILVFVLLLWEYLSSHNIINSFIYSSPSKIFKTIILLLIAIYANICYN